MRSGNRDTESARARVSDTVVIYSFVSGPFELVSPTICCFKFP